MNYTNRNVNILEDETTGNWRVFFNSGYEDVSLREYFTLTAVHDDVYAWIRYGHLPEMETK